MARQRAGQAKAAFARVGNAPVGDVPASDLAGDDASITASGNADGTDIMKADIPDATSVSSKESDSAIRTAAGTASRLAGGKAGGRAGKKAGKRRRRVGRPRGPERVPLTVRILTATDERLTAAVEATGDSPQYIVDQALSEYLARLGF